MSFVVAQLLHFCGGSLLRASETAGARVPAAALPDGADDLGRDVSVAAARHHRAASGLYMSERRADVVIENRPGRRRYIATEARRARGAGRRHAADAGRNERGGRIALYGPCCSTSSGPSCRSWGSPRTAFVIIVPATFRELPEGTVRLPQGQSGKVHGRRHRYSATATVPDRDRHQYGARAVSLRRAATSPTCSPGEVRDRRSTPMRAGAAARSSDGERRGRWAMTTAKRIARRCRTCRRSAEAFQAYDGRSAGYGRGRAEPARPPDVIAIAQPRAR